MNSRYFSKDPFLKLKLCYLVIAEFFKCLSKFRKILIEITISAAYKEKHGTVKVRYFSGGETRQ